MKTLTHVILLLSFFFFNCALSYSQVSVQIVIAPPPIPVYVQPYCPVQGYLWTPGYWAYDDNDYYWVPGMWMEPAQTGFYWTPGYWGYSGGYYGWSQGYWGPQIGYYGGISYGYGYYGDGYWGGRWEGNTFQYNTAVTNINTTIINNTYVDNSKSHTNNNHISFNGKGGVERQPTERERAVMNGNHIKPTSKQQNHEQMANDCSLEFNEQSF